VIGKFCGPSITSFLYSLGGITFSFIICSSFLLASFHYALLLKFKKFDYKESDQPLFKEDFFSTLVKIDIFFLFLLQFLNVFTKTFLSQIILIHIHNKFSISMANASKLMSLSYISYIFTAYYLSSIITRLGSIRCIAVGIFLNLIGLTLMNSIEIFPQ